MIRAERRYAISSGGVSQAGIVRVIRIEGYPTLYGTLHPCEGQQLSLLGELDSPFLCGSCKLIKMSKTQ